MCTIEIHHHVCYNQLLFLQIFLFIKYLHFYMNILQLFSKLLLLLLYKYYYYIIYIIFLETKIKYQKVSRITNRITTIRYLSETLYTYVNDRNCKLTCSSILALAMRGGIAVMLHTNYEGTCTHSSLYAVWELLGAFRTHNS